MHASSKIMFDTPLVVGYEVVNNCLSCLGSDLDVGMVTLFAVYLDASLALMCLIMIMDKAFILFISVVASIGLGWIKKFERGLYRSFALGDLGVVTDVFRTASVSGRVACVPLLTSVHAECIWDRSYCVRSACGRVEG
jgi:hypothetical protein